ncbi:DUF6191 domain-containing protein [Streptomyces sp. NPDC057557]
MHRPHFLKDASPDDSLDGAPPRMEVDLDAGTAVVRRKPES